MEVLDGDFSITWLLRKVPGIDYFHFHWPSFAYAYRTNLPKTFSELTRFLLFLALIKLHGKRILWTAHNLYPHDKGRRICVRIDLFVRHVITRLASRIFVHGPTAAHTLSQEFPRTRNKITVIDHGHWIHYYKNSMSRASARATLQLSNDRFVFLFVGLCKRYKNLPALIEAFKQLSSDVMLQIAGRFPDATYLKEIVDLVKGHEDRIRIIPNYIPDDELQVYLNSSDVVVLPYTEIVTSGTAMLAISFGKPVVAPSKGHLMDVINSDCGLLYEAEDPNGLLKALVEIQGRSFSEEKIVARALTYDWGKIADTVHRTLVAAAHS